MDKFYEKKYQDMETRLYRLYDEIEGVENSIEEVKNRLLNIRQQKISEDGPEPVRVGEIPRFYKGLIEQQDACEGLVVEAVIEGSYKKALQAFTLNRTIPSANVAKEILDEMIEANKEYWVELK